MKKLEVLKQKYDVEVVRATFRSDGVFVKDSDDEWSDVFVTEKGSVIDPQFSKHYDQEYVLDIVATNEYARIYDGKPFSEWTFECELALYFDGTNYIAEVVVLDGTEVESITLD